MDPFTCPFWWNHWQASVNLDWAVLEPAVRAALARLAAMRQAGGQPASSAGAELQQGAGAGGEAQAARR